MKRLQLTTLIVFTAAGMLGSLPQLFAQPSPEQSYREMSRYLGTHTRLIELKQADTNRLLVAPDYQGRVMISTCEGEQGPYFGFLNFDRIESEKNDPHFNNFGGEDRFWLSPEGGPFALWFKPEVNPQTLADWYTPAAFNEGSFEVIGPPSASEIRLRKQMKLSNASRTEFSVTIDRTVRFLNADDLARHFGAASALMKAPQVQCVAFESVNDMTNDGPPMTREGGMLSIWTLGQNKATPKSVVVVPYRPGSLEERGPIVKSDYFGEIPPERLKVIPSAILFRADAGHRGEIGVSQRRVKNVMGAYDFGRNALTIVQINLPEAPEAELYLDNAWDLPQKNPYIGDVVNSYNDGPVAPGEKGFGPFFELETLSRCHPLATGEKLTHISRTLHLVGTRNQMAEVARAVLGVELDEVEQAMFGKTP